MTVAGKAARKLAKEGNVEGLKDLLRDTSWVDEASRVIFSAVDNDDCRRSSHIASDRVYSSSLGI